MSAFTPGPVLLVTGAVVAVLAAGLLAVQFFISPLGVSAATAYDLELQRDDLIVRRGELLSSISTLNPSAEPRGILPAGEAATTRIALQQRIGEAITAAGGELLSSEASDAVTDGRTKLTTAIRARFDEPALVAFVQAIEQTEPYLLFQKIDIQPARDRKHPALEVSAQIVGYLLDAP